MTPSPQTSPPQAGLQAGEYTLPYHWIGMDRNCLARYLRLSDQLARLIRQYAPSGPGLDIGCGDGRSTFEVARQLGPEYSLTGIDHDPRAIHFAKLFAPGLEFRAVDATSLLPWPDQSISFVCSREVLEHIPPAALDHFIAEQRRILKPGGVAICTVPSTNLPLAAKHFQHFTSDILVRLFAQFDPLELFGFGERPKGLAENLFLLLDRCPRVWKLYLNRWQPTAPARGDVLVGAFRKTPPAPL